MDEITELKLLQVLEGKIREMFHFSGWAEDVDEDAAQTVINVEAVLKDLTNWRLLHQRYSSSPEPNPKRGSPPFPEAEAAGGGGNSPDVSNAHSAGEQHGS